MLVLLGLSTTAVAEPKKDDFRQRKRLYVRGVYAHVEPRIETRNIQLEPTRLASLGGVGGGSFDDSGVNVNGSTGPTAILGYVPDISGRISIETVLGVPVPLKIEATGRLATESLAPEAVGQPTGIPPLGRDLAQAMIAAPMVTAIYRPIQTERLNVFGGVGASVLFVYGERITNPVLTEVAAPHLQITHAFGAVVQAGFEARLWKRMMARLDAKYIIYREAHATIDDIQVRTQLAWLPTVDVGSASMAVAARPVIIQFGIGADF